MQMPYRFMASILKRLLNQRQISNVLQRCYVYRPMVLLRLSFILLPLFFFYCYGMLILHSSRCCALTSNIIISLTSAPARFSHELPITIYSLMMQTHLPQEIRLHLSATHKNFSLSILKASIQRLDSSMDVSRLFEQLVRIRYEQYDYGPSTKFIPILKELHAIETNDSSSQLIMICDDDVYYHPHTLVTLQQYSNQFNNSIIGFRGWRGRSSFTEKSFKAV